MKKFKPLLLAMALTSLFAGACLAAEEQSPAAVTAPAAETASGGALPSDASARKQVKVGYIDMSKVAAESARGKASREQLVKKSEQLRKKLEQKEKQLEKQKKAIEAKLPGMTPKERAAKGKEFQKKVEDFQKQVRTSELEVAELQDKLTAEMFVAIKDVALEYAKANGYDILAEMKSLLYVVDDIATKDITDDIIAQLDKQPAK